MALDDTDIALVKGMIARGDRQHDIAAYFGVNGGRIGEISTGMRGEGIAAAAASDLPPPGPYMTVRSSVKARETLVALRDLIDDTIKEIDMHRDRED